MVLTRHRHAIQTCWAQAACDMAALLAPTPFPVGPTWYGTRPAATHPLPATSFREGPPPHPLKFVVQPGGLPAGRGSVRVSLETYK